MAPNMKGIKEKSLIIIKPDAIQRGLVSSVISRFERKGIKIVGLKMMTLNEAVLREHYAHHKDKPFFKSLSKFMQSTPVIVLCLEGLNVVNAARLVCGITKSSEAEPGSIRGDLAMSTACNVIHASESVSIAEKEIKRFFKPDELYEYDKSEYMHVYGEDERK